MPWQRPENVPIGQVWSRFKGKERPGLPTYMYQIRDMDDSIRRKCLDLMARVFLEDEPLCDALGINDDPVSIKTIKANWEGYVSQNVSLACFTEVDGEPDELVGFNIVLVKTRDDEEESLDNVEGEPWKKLLRVLIEAESLVNIFDHYDVDVFMTSSGLTVLPKHRGQNIGAKFFAAREPLCRALGIKVSATVLTAITSQVLAKKSGFVELAELKYADMLKYDIDLSKCKTPTAKLMAVQYN